MGIPNNLKIPDSFCVSRDGIFFLLLRVEGGGGLNFGPGIFSFLFLSPFDHPCHLKSGVPVPPPPPPHPLLVVAVFKKAVMTQIRDTYNTNK